MCKLHKAIHGLKQALRAWFAKLHGAVLFLGFISAKSDQSIFIKVTPLHQTYLLVYLDDILIIGSDHECIPSLVYNVNKAFALEDLGEMSYFLGIRVSKLPNWHIHLSQRKYIIDILSSTKIQYAKCMSTPRTSGLKLTAQWSDPVQQT